MWVSILQFRAGYDPKNNLGSFHLRLGNNTNVELKVDSAQEFSAIMALLQERSVTLNTQTGVIATGPEPVGS